jgi:hypothetical protein
MICRRLSAYSSSVIAVSLRHGEVPDQEDRPDNAASQNEQLQLHVTPEHGLIYGIRRPMDWGRIG